METDENVTKEIKKQVVVKLILFFVMFGLVFFLPARTFKYWEAWVYIGILFICASIVIVYFLKKDPHFLDRRMRTKEKVKEQKLLIKLGWLLFMPSFILPGFDRYYGWSNVPIWLIVVSDLLVLAGYLFVFRVFKENSFASRVVEVDANQKVIDTGPYSVLRHPMYTGILLMYGFTPLALGSFWALIGSLFLFLIIIARIFNEEKYLSENLPGYKEYLQKVKYRIVPKVW